MSYSATKKFCMVLVFELVNVFYDDEQISNQFMICAIKSVTNDN
jgi:hypothetical protein